MKCYLIDIDGTLVVPGVNTPIPGAIEECNRLYDAGHQVYLFSCWPTTMQSVRTLLGLGIRFHGLLSKPLADAYVMIDDKLVPEECRKVMLASGDHHGADQDRVMAAESRRKG